MRHYDTETTNSLPIVLFVEEAEPAYTVSDEHLFAAHPDLKNWFKSIDGRPVISQNA